MLNSPPSPNEAFFKLPQIVYAQDPFYISEDRSLTEWLFSDAHDFFEEGESWVGIESGKTRLAGFFHPSYYAPHTAYFGYWETVDEWEPNQKLFTEFEAWARSKNARQIYGPINFTTIHNYRLQLDTFDAPCFPYEPHNPPHYIKLCERLGYTLSDTYYTSKGGIEPISYIFKKPNPYYKKIKSNFKIDYLDKYFLLDRVNDFYEVAFASLDKNTCLSKLSLNTFRKSYLEPLAKKLCPITSRYVLDSEGALAGFSWIFPDWGSIACQSYPSPHCDKRYRLRKTFPPAA